MEPFIVSARKYRPATFKDVVGQQAITNTLDNAIESNHLAQALLFTGPRGVGKTTCARILAKKINSDGTEDANEDFAFNVFELDAASNNSVDDIRALIDQVRIPPQVGKYKVYIIDEVHMLSSAAFNAFLKTLEEPPKHCIFILATTEKHKIIPTILSRCQIFDFRRITVQDIKGHLANVAVQEGITAEDDALHIIAQKADGALRDALSIFDRVVSFSGNNLTREAVTENLNVLDYTYYFNVTKLLLANDIPNTLLAYNEILAKGFDGHHFVMGLASHFRDLLVCKNQQTIMLLEVGEQVKKMYHEQSQLAETSFLMDGITIANDCDLKYRTSRNQRLLVELCLLQLASLTARDEKKKSSKLGTVPRFVLPPAHFKNKIVSPPETLDAPKASKAQITSTVVNEVTEPETTYHTKSQPEHAIVANIAIDTNVKKTSAFSLKSIREKKELQKVQEENKPDQNNLPTEAFTKEAFLASWNAYAKILEGEGKRILLSHLTMQVPQLEGTVIHLKFPNDTIKVEVEREKHGLLTYLRAQLQNYNIELAIEVNEEEVKRYAYTDREKFEKLKEKNPLIEKLRITFDLDL